PELRPPAAVMSGAAAGLLVTVMAAAAALGGSSSAPLHIEWTTWPDDCYLQCGNRRYEINSREAKIKAAASGGYCVAFYRRFTCAHRSAVRCTDTEGVVRDVPHRWSGCNDPTTAVTLTKLNNPPTSAAAPTGRGRGGIIGLIVIVGILLVIL
ncbi:hypothetical protein GDO81_023516, partial [Engystomops pustulosus]